MTVFDSHASHAVSVKFTLPKVFVVLRVATGVLC